MKTITICNQKGGVAKTTTTQMLVAIFSDKGYKVLAIDCDGQRANLTSALGGDGSNSNGMFEVLTNKSGKVKIEDYIQQTAFCDLIAAGSEMLGIDKALNDRIGREFVLSKILKSHLKQEYDFIIIDTPAALNIATLNALVASDDVIVPTLADTFSVTSMETLLQNISEVKDCLNPNISIAGILVTVFRKNTRVQSEFFDVLKKMGKDLGIPVFASPIRQTIGVQEMQLTGITNGLASLNKTVIEDYRSVVDEYLKGK